MGSNNRPEGIFSLEVAWEDSASVGVWVSCTTVSAFCVCLTCLAIYTRRIFGLDDSVDCIRVFALNTSKTALLAGGQVAPKPLTLPMGATRCAIGWAMIATLLAFAALILLCAAFRRVDPKWQLAANRELAQSPPATDITPADSATPSPPPEPLLEPREPCLSCVHSRRIIFRPLIAVLAIIPVLDTCLQVGADGLTG